MPQPVTEHDDIQGLVRAGYGSLKEAIYLLLRVRDRAAAKAWLASAPVTSVADMRSRLQEARHLAFTAAGLRALGVGQSIVEAVLARIRVGHGGRGRPLAQARRHRRRMRRRTGNGAAARASRTSSSCSTRSPAAPCRASRERSDPGHSRRPSRSASWRLEHGRPRAFRLRRRHQPAAHGLGRGARREHQRRSGIRQLHRAGRIPARLPERIRPLHRPSASQSRPGRGRRPAVRAGRRRPARPRPQRHLSGVPPAAPGRARFLALHRLAVGAHRAARLAEAMVGRTISGDPLVPLLDRPIRGVGPDATISRATGSPTRATATA